MSDDIGDEDRVVVLCRGPVDGLELGLSLRGVLLCGAVDGRTADIEERDCINCETPIPKGASLLETFLISNVVRDGARC